MQLFNEQPNMLSELDRLERLMPQQSDLLRKLSKTIRNQIWGVSDEYNLAIYLNRANWIFEIAIEALGETYHLVDMYIDLLCKQSRYFTINEICDAFVSLKEEISILKTQELMKEHWKQLNPLFSSEFDNDDKFERSILELFDDVYKETAILYPEEFVVNLGTINYICRGRRGCRKSSYELLPPPLGIGGINRWNPPNKRYGYYAASFDSSMYDADFSSLEKTCYEELRITKGGDVTFADFVPVPSATNCKILDLDYEKLSRQDVKQVLIDTQSQLTSEIVLEMLSSGMAPDKNNISKMISAKSSLSDRAVRVFCGKLFFKELCEAIFIPIDDDQLAVDALYKEKCYTSFHLLAGFLEKQGIAGVLFPSTRMMLAKQMGTNLVLFNPDNVELVDSSMRTKTV